MRLHLTSIALLSLAIASLPGWGCGGDTEETLPPAGGSGQGAHGGDGGAGNTTGGTGGAGNSGGGGAGNSGGGGTGGQGGAPLPAGCITGDFAPYHGDLHAHTSYSDGQGTPQDAFAMARNVAGLDIMVVTDHVEQIYLPPAINKWGDCQAQADAANAPGSFVASCGFEYGSGMSYYPPCVSTGHNNVFFSGLPFGAEQLDFHDFYASLAGCSTCVGQFNHPGEPGLGECQTWNDFEYSAAADARLNLFEMNGDGPAWDLFFAALDAGWHLSPMNNQDNHSANWGTADDRRSGFYLTALTRVALQQAMVEGRTFSTRDKNASIRVMAAGECWMGSVLSQVSSPVAMSVTAEDADPSDGFATIALFGPAKASLGTFDCAGQQSCTASFALPVSGPSYVVARATQSDGDELVAAPIWVAP